MSVRATAALAMVVAAMTPASNASLAPEPQRPTFRAATDVVAVDVSVREGSRVITGLSADQFVVLDNGVPQQVTDLSYGKLPIDVTVALDVSYSVTGRLLDQLRLAIRDLMRDLRAGDRLKLIMFNMRVSRVVDFTTDVAAVDSAIGAAVAGGGSSIRDALAVALVSASAPERRQLVVVFTDAADSSSTTRPETLLDVARRTNASVASVIPLAVRAGPVSASEVLGRTVVGPPPLRPAAAEGASLLQRLAAETGGTQLRVAAGASLGASFRRVLDDFRSSYVLHYVPQGVERGGFHALEVGVKGRRTATIRARRGYYWQ
jgi:VWFA-related protein